MDSGIQQTCEVKLDQWAIVKDPTNPYLPPELSSMHLHGKCYGHSRHKDGESVITSYVMHADGKIVYTKNTKYVLGDAHPDYIKWYEECFKKPLNQDCPFLEHQT